MALKIVSNPDGDPNNTTEFGGTDINAIKIGRAHV